MSNLGCNGNLEKADVWNGIKQHARTHAQKAISYPQRSKQLNSNMEV